MTDKPIPERLRRLPVAAAEFLMEIDEVCLKHGMVLSVEQEDWRRRTAPIPALEIRHYNREDHNLLWNAKHTLVGVVKRDQVEETRESAVWLPCHNPDLQVTLYKGYSLLVAPSDNGALDGFINGRLYRKSGTFEEVATMLFDIVDLRDPPDSPTSATKG